MNALQVVTERIAELNFKIEQIKNKLTNREILDDFDVRKCNLELKQINTIKEVNEIIYMNIKGFH